jgi:hypothetical protein
MQDSNAQMGLKCSDIAIQHVILTTARSRPAVGDLQRSARRCMCQNGLSTTRARSPVRGSVPMLILLAIRCPRSRLLAS